MTYKEEYHIRELIRSPPPLAGDQDKSVHGESVQDESVHGESVQDESVRILFHHRGRPGRTRGIRLIRSPAKGGIRMNPFTVNPFRMNP